MAAPGKERDRVWAALSANALVLPGAGSLMLGRRSGWIQAALSIAGFVLGMVWLVHVARQWMAGGLGALRPIPHLGAGLLALGLMVGAWVWGMCTAWAAVRQARR
jgi:hypothetical protein